MNTVHVARSETAIHPFTAEVTWKGPPFYVSRFFRKSAMKKGITHEYKSVYEMVVP